jgi:hypothetical protein
MLVGMMCCAYCGQQASMKILATPDQVCFDHALEFWTGLLVYAMDSSDCVKHARLCGCRSCEELDASCLRASAIAAAGPSPGDHERFAIRLAS